MHYDTQIDGMLSNFRKFVIGRWCPWLLLILQSAVLILLVRELPECSVPHCSRTHCPEATTTIPPAETRVDLKRLVSNSQIDRRVQSQLPTVIPMNVSRIFYNRVPKCGSSTMMDLMTTMGELHNFTFVRDGVFMTFFLEEPGRKLFADKVLSYPTPVIYERHLHFLNFEDYNYHQPVYINLVRDPLERLVSWYYFRRFQDGHVRDMPTEQRFRTYDACVLGNHSECVQPLGEEAEEGFFKLVPFFCGQESYCREPTEKAIVQAIFNVKQHYAVVGVIEEYEKFIQVLEYVLPSYFRGAPKVFKVLQNEWQGRHRTTYKLPISYEVRNIMKKKLKLEYQFYEFLRTRFSGVYDVMEAAEIRYKLR